MNSLFICFWVTLVLLGLGCSPTGTPSSPKTVQKKTATGLSAVERQARFLSRIPSPIPKTLPKRWTRFLEALESKPISIKIRQTTHQTARRGTQDIDLHFRLFGLDTDVDKTLADRLVKLGLRGVKMPAQDQKNEGPLKGWSLVMDRVVAAPGIARQTDIKLNWYRRPKSPNTPGKCRKPKALKLDRVVPKWIRAGTSVRSTRRVIESELMVTADEVTVRLQMLYHNGYAQDENVGVLVKAAQSHGYVKRSGDGPNQRLGHPGGARLALRSIRRGPDMGCVPRGPILELEWYSPLTQ
ncbi:MAG: hypothetical protein CMH52_07065 [Myxococcales bacterium]|nr:hypothetical protein [Myxococcales bacterium]